MLLIVHHTLGAIYEHDLYTLRCIDSESGVLCEQELNKLEGEWMWSDTGSFCKESEGDVVKVHDPNRYNFASP